MQGTDLGLGVTYVTHVTVAHMTEGTDLGDGVTYVTHVTVAHMTEGTDLSVGVARAKETGRCEHTRTRTQLSHPGAPAEDLRAQWEEVGAAHRALNR